MHIVLTGGGSAGHVLPNIAVAEELRALTHGGKTAKPASKTKLKLSYMGSYKGPEADLAKRAKIPFVPVSTGKLRRYFSLKTVVDFFRVPYGVLQAFVKFFWLKPGLIFSKGGFVGFPAVVAGWMHGKPVIIHESDSIPGLATKLCAPFASHILLGYESAKPRLGRHAKKAKVIGNPIRSEVLQGSLAKAKKFTGFSGKRPVLLVMGGSSGSQEINQLIEKERQQLTQYLDIVHITGQGKGPSKRRVREPHYMALAYVHEELKDLYALASLALSRAGASAIAELEALQIPTLLWPLGLHASRGDQIQNTKEKVAAHTVFKQFDPKQPLSKQYITLPIRTLGKKSKPSKNVAREIAHVILSTCK